MDKEQTVENDDVLSMSDDDVLNMSPEEFIAKQEQGEEEEASTEVEETETETETETEETEEVEEEEEVSPSEALPESQREDVFEQEETEEADQEEEAEVEEASESEKTEGYDSDNVDYKTQYENLLAPFKASGREVKVNTIDDARRLMQMGVDYQQKMRSMKPHLKIMKALERNDLLDENKVNLLIDLDKKNPEAIAKFLKDKGIDPYQLNLEETTEYTPENHAPSDREMALDEVLDSIRGTSSFDRTISEIGSNWDNESKQLFMESPSLVKALNEHIGVGIYDQIMNVVSSERLMGRLEGLNDLAAYKSIGDALQAKGAFKHLNAEPKPTRKNVQDPKLKERKKAASPTKRTVAPKSKPDYNPLAMSDEDFEKIAVKQNF